MKQTKIKNTTVAIILCVLVIVIGFSAWNILNANAKQIRDKLFDSNSESLTDTYTEICYNFEENVQGRWNSLEDIALALKVDQENGNETVKSYLDSVREERGFTGFYLVNENGNYRTLDGESGYIDFGKKLFSLTDDHENIIVDGSLPKVKNVMFYAIPVEQNSFSGFNYCILAFGYTVDDMAELFTVNAYNGESNAYITYENGRVSTSAENDTVSISNIISYLKDNDVDSSIVSKVTEDFKENQTNTILVTIEEKDYYLHYQPLGLQNWMMVSLTPSEAINAAANEVQNITARSLWMVFSILIFVILGITVVALIITMRRNRSEITKRDQMFTVMSENMDDAYVMLNYPDCSVSYVSPNTSRLFGVNSDEIRKDFWSICKVSKTKIHLNNEDLMKLKPGQELSVELEMQMASTGKIKHYVLLIQHPENENSSVLVAIFSDRTKEEEVKQKIQSALKMAESANKAKSAFLFNMSHDIRTPMNAIIGYSNLLEKYRDDPKKEEDYLKKIRSSSDFLLSLINNVLEMARIESGKMALDEFPCPSRKIFDEISGVYSELMKDKKIEFITKEYLKTEYLYIDSVKMNEIFLNIVSNAYKYTPEGGKVSMTLEELPSDQEGFVLVRTTISDTGIGMSKEYLPTIFEEFSREQTSTQNKIQGTGLGMPIVKKLIELMSGTIEVQSELGKGSTFIVTIPHRIAEKPVESSEEEVTDVSLFAGKRILLAEDNDLNAEIAIEILNEFGFKVEHAEDGIICVDMLNKAEEDYYDLILMDVQMPNLDGYGATKRIRSLDDYEKASIPIIAMTANAFEEDKQNALAAGMNGHLAKPIEISKLTETLSDILKNKKVVIPMELKKKTEEDALTHVKKIYFEMKRSKAVSILPGGFFAYMAEQPEKLIFANELCCSIWGCKDFEEFNELVGGSFKGIVHADDYERVEKEIWNQIDSGDTGLDQVKYKIIKKDGTVSHVDDYGRLVRNKEVGDIFYVFVAERLNSQK